MTDKIDGMPDIAYLVKHVNLKYHPDNIRVALRGKTLPKDHYDYEYTKTSTVNKQIVETMIKLGFATGHGSSVADLLSELEWQVNEIREQSKKDKYQLDRMICAKKDELNNE